MTWLEWFIYFNISFIVRMLVVFTLMMLYYNWVDKDSLLWKLTGWLWKTVAAIFYVLDVLYNYAMTLYTLDLPDRPGEPVTERLTRYVHDYAEYRTVLEQWRYILGSVFCRILHMSDPGHCGGYPK